VVRAGEVGQRIHLGATAVLSRDDWSGDFDDIKRLSNLSGTELDELVKSLGAKIESWLKEPEPSWIWKNLTEVLTERGNPQQADPDRFRSALEGDELQKLLDGTPEFPAALLPDLPRRANSSG
jgi:hypothetical protein